MPGEAGPFACSSRLLLGGELSVRSAEALVCVGETVCMLNVMHTCMLLSIRSEGRTGLGRVMMGVSPMSKYNMQQI